MIVPPHFKTITHCHSEAYHAWPPKIISALSFAHIFDPCIYHSKFVASLPLTSIPLHPHLSLSCPLDIRQQWESSTSLQLNFLVYCCLLCFSTLLFSGQVSLIPSGPTKFHHHLTAWSHSTLVTPGS